MIPRDSDPHFQPASPERRRQIAEAIALGCGWESLEAMRRDIRDELGPAEPISRALWAIERNVRDCLGDRRLNGEPELAGQL